MGSKRDRDKGRPGLQNLVRLITLGLIVTAVVKELRTPAGERTWNGVVAGFVPYDFRAPTLARFKERMWAPTNEHLITPRPFGVGWTLNAGRVVALARHQA